MGKYLNYGTQIYTFALISF